MRTLTNSAGWPVWGSDTPTLTQVAASTSSVLILAANDNRLYASVYNNGSANLFLAWGPLAGLAAFTARVVPGAFYEVPHGRNPYLGQLSGIWAGTGGNAQITEAT